MIVRHYAYAAMSLLLLALLVAFAWAYAPVLAAAPEPIEACPEWRKAGGQLIYKCVDEEALVTCYAPAGGVMQCVPFQ